MKAFFDTNVLMDVFGRREPFYADAVGAWNFVEEGKIEGYVSALSFANVFYIVRKLVDLKAAREALAIMRDGFSMVGCDRDIISRAMESEMRDFEDAIQYFSALDAGVQYLVTRNARDFPEGGTLMVVAPDEFARLLASEGESHLD